MNIFFKRYGSYLVGFLAAAGALIGSILLPALASQLIGAAGLIFAGTLFFSGVNRPFGQRALFLLAAAGAVGFTVLLPAHTTGLMTAAMVLALLAFLFS